MPAGPCPILWRIAPFFLLPFLVSAVPSEAGGQTESVIEAFRARVDALVATRGEDDGHALEAALPTQAPNLSSRAGAILATGSNGDISMRRPSSNPADLIRQRFDPRDRSTYLDPARAFLESRYGSSPHLESYEQEEAGADELESEPEPSGTITYPHPGGDLNGDGLEDVLVEELDSSYESVALQAIRGTDGKELWRVEIAGADDGFGYSVGDITGDGKDDILIQALEFLEWSESEECTETDCRYDYADRVRLIVGLRSGATGHKLWAKQYEGTFNYHFEDHYTSDTTTASYEAEDRLRTTNLFFFPLLSGDHDGDAKPDIVLDAIDWDFDVTYQSDHTGVSSEEIWLTGTENLHIADRYATRGSLLSGDDGERLALLSAPRGPSVSVLEPGVDVAGDGVPELFWSTWGIPDFDLSCEQVVLSQCQASEDNYTFTLETLDGTSLESVWSMGLDGDAIPFFLEFDASNDGVNDVVVWSRPPDSEEFVLDVIDGRDGHSLWTRRTADELYPIATGEYGGGPGKDLLAVGFRFPPAGDPLEEQTDATLIFARLEGGSGQTLFETEYPFPEATSLYDFTIIYGGGMADASGDGQDDAYSGSWTLRFTEDPETGEVQLAGADSEYRFESGTDGSVLHSSDGPSFFEVYPEPDLDGDGAADMSEWHYPLDDGGEFRAILQTLAPPTVLWEQAIPVADAWETTFIPSGDQDGVPGAEVLYGLNTQEDGAWTSLVSSLTGATGAERWRSQR